MNVQSTFISFKQYFSQVAAPKRKRIKTEHEDVSDWSDSSLSSQRTKSKPDTDLNFFDVDTSNFLRVFDLYNSCYAEKRVELFLNIVNKYLLKNKLSCFKIRTDILWTTYFDDLKGVNRKRSNYLTFRLNDFDVGSKRLPDIHLKPFEMFTKKHGNDFFKIINTGGEVTAMDWLCKKFIDKKSEQKSTNKVYDLSTQYFAYTVKPRAELNKITFKKCFYSSEDKIKQEEELENVHAHNEPNFIYICRCYCMNFIYQSGAELFAIYNKYIGTVNCLKWRNDFGTLYNYKSDKCLNFLGYLLAASSNGNGYIYLVHDLINKIPNGKEAEYNTIDDVDCYIPLSKIVLKRKKSTGECLSADWLQTNGATVAALGFKTLLCFFLYFI